MRGHFSQFRPGTAFSVLASLLVILAFSGCWKKSGEAVVLEKEYIAAAEKTPTPAAEQTAPPVQPSATPNDENEEYKRFEVGENEIVVDTYVMKREERGTGRDPRALTNEQWLVTVQMVEGGRRIKVQADRPQFEKLKVGDRVKVSYREGKYTGTAWSAKIDP